MGFMVLGFLRVGGECIKNCFSTHHASEKFYATFINPPPMKKTQFPRSSVSSDWRIARIEICITIYYSTLSGLQDVAHQDSTNTSVTFYLYNNMLSNLRTNT